MNRELILFCRKTPQKQFLAGSLAGMTSQSLTYPLDFARARMAVTHKDEYATLRQVSLNPCYYLYNNQQTYLF